MPVVQEIGAVSELLVAKALIEAGFSVFRNMAPVGTADLIAYRDGTSIPIDVKTARLDTRKRARRALPTWSTRGQSPAQRAQGVIIVHVYDGHPDISPVIKRHAALSSLNRPQPEQTVATQIPRKRKPKESDHGGQG